MPPLHRACFTLLVAVLAPTARAQGAAEDSLPLYTITATIDPADAAVHAVARVTIREPRAAGAAIVFDLMSAGEEEAHPRIQLERATLEGDPGAAITIDSAQWRLTIQPTVDSLADTSVAVISMVYSIALDAKETKHTGRFGFAAEGDGSAWYPELLEPERGVARFYDFDVELIYPRRYAALTTGTATGSDRLDPTHRRTRYSAQHVDGFSIDVNRDMQIVSASRDSIRVVAVAPADSADSVRASVAALARAISRQRRRHDIALSYEIGVLPQSARTPDGVALPRAPSDDEARALLARALFREGRDEDVITLVGTPSARACSDVFRCRAAMLYTRALWREGRRDEARTIADALASGAARRGLDREWRRVSTELALIDARSKRVDQP